MRICSLMRSSRNAICRILQKNEKLDSDRYPVDGFWTSKAGPGGVPGTGPGIFAAPGQGVRGRNIAPSPSRRPGPGRAQASLGAAATQEARRGTASGPRSAASARSFSTSSATAISLIASSAGSRVSRTRMRPVAASTSCLPMTTT